jgi:hypothetical protein
MLLLFLGFVFSQAMMDPAIRTSKDDVHVLARYGTCLGSAVLATHLWLVALNDRRRVLGLMISGLVAGILVMGLFALDSLLSTSVK